MTIIVNDLGFSPDDWSDCFLGWDKAKEDIGMVVPGTALDVPNNLDGNELIPILGNIALIRIPFSGTHALDVAAGLHSAC